MSILLLVLGLLLFVSLVVVHEFGHFLVARRSGVDVEEFGIGFPPRAWKKKLKNGVLFTLNWLPIGGFVRLKGEHDADTEPGSYGAANTRAKTKILLAGVGMNLLAAFLVLTLLGWVGTPDLVDNQFNIKSDTKVMKNEVLVGYVEPGSPAEIAGLKRSDQLLSISQDVSDTVFCQSTDCGPKSSDITSSDGLPDVTKGFAGQKVIISYKRDNKTASTTAQLRSQDEVEASKKTDNPKGYLGISPTEYKLTRSTWSAPIRAAGEIVQFTALTFEGLGKAVGALFAGQAGQASSQVAGPVGIFVLLKDGSLLGYQFILVIIAIISLTLAIMNVLPIPALDGGRLFVTLIFKGLKKPLTQKTEELIHGTGFALLMVLFVLITIVDVRRFL